MANVFDCINLETAPVSSSAMRLLIMASVAVETLYFVVISR